MEGVFTKPAIIKPRILVDKKIIHQALEQLDVEKQVVVHCNYNDPSNDSSIQICKTTYLRDCDSKHKSKLLNAFNISIEPIWMPYSVGTNARFTLIFSSLPASCTKFDLFEETDCGAFYSGIITRNESDVYSVEICY